jgi:hypothetical protein
MVSSIPMQKYKRENNSNRQNKERQNRVRWRKWTPCPMTQCRRYAIETRYQMQTSMTMSIFLCCGGRALCVSLLCAFDNFVRIMASRVSFVLLFVRSYLVRNENICGWEEVWLEVYKPAMLQGAEAGINRSWPTSRRVSWEGGAEECLTLNEKR